VAGERIVRFPLWKRKQQEQLEQEIQSHLQVSKHDRICRGETSAHAERSAHREFGNIALVENVTRDQWGWNLLEDFLQDLHYATRMFRRNPGFTAIAILTLALGIGANTAIFSVMDAVVLRPLPFVTPDRLVWLNGKFPQTDEAAVSPPDFVDYRASNQSFERLGAMGYRSSPASLSGDKPEQVLNVIVSAGFFDTLGIQPLLGRDFLPEDEQVATPQVVILGHRIWRRAFAADPDIIGRNIKLDGQSLTFVGVLPIDLPLLSEAQIWLPAPLRNPGMNIRLTHFLKVVGRLKPGFSLRRSQLDLDAIAAQIARQYPDTNEGWTLRQRPLFEVLKGPVRPALLLISAAVGLLLLIACVNVANLLLARLVTRQREFALRAALGASSGRMIRQALTESVVLALTGGALGVLGATWGIHALRAVGPSDLPRLDEVHISAAVVLFTTSISLLTGVVFGLIPALQVSGRQFTQGLKESGRGSVPSAHKRVSGTLVVCEIAVSLTLLVCAGLVLKSFWRLIHVNPGFETGHVMSARLSLNAPAYDNTHRERFWRQLEERVSLLPGVQAVGATSELPLNNEHNDNPFAIEGHTYSPGEFDDANFRQVTPGFFSAMRIPVLAGRCFDQHDAETSAAVLVVNQAFGKRFFPAQNPLGKRLRVLADPLKMREIVGIVGNTSHDALSESEHSEMYVPSAQYSPQTMHIVVRASTNPENLPVALREVVSALDKNETLSAVRSMDEVLDASVAQPRFSSQLLGLFAALALLLASIGLYGLMAYFVTQRTNEIGVRMALGATRKDILTLVLKNGSLLAFTGIGLGLLVSAAATHLLTSLLFGVTPTDPQTFLGAALLLVVVALGACYIPARRATRVDPMVALRYE
jgi:putative ABC transport system permease protein